MASTTTTAQRRSDGRERGEPADRRDLLRGPVRALGARQLERDGARLHRGRAPVARGVHATSSARPRCGTTALFFWGEDAVADNLSPYIDAAPREEQKYFLTTQQVDEARHAVFFKRFMQEVCGIGDGSMASGLNAIKPQLTSGFRKIFDRLDTMADELRADRSPAKLAAAVTLYHIVIEATLAQPGQHFICSYLEERDLLPAFREGMENIARRRAAPHRLRREAARRPQPRRPGGRAEGGRAASCARSPATPPQVLMPPGWDERYLTVLRLHLRQGRRRGRDVDDDQAALGGTAARERCRARRCCRRASRRWRSHSAAARSRRPASSACAKGPSKRDPETLALLFDTIRRQVNPDHGLTRPTTFQWEFTDPDVPTWHLTVEQRLEHGRAGRGAEPRPAPAPLLPGLGGHRRRAPGPAAGGRHRAAAPARQPARAGAADEGVSAGLTLG